MATNDSRYIEQIGYKIYRNFGKSSSQGFIIKNIKTGFDIFNLSSFDIYDYIRCESPKELLLGLAKFYMELSDNKNVTNHTPENLKECSINECKNILVNNNKHYYELFKELVNLEKILINDFSFKPIPNEIYIENGLTYLNLYKLKSKFKNVVPDLLAPFPNFEFIIKNICGNQINYDYFMDFIAYKLQNPLDVPPCHIVIKDNGGTGKSDLLLGDILENIINIVPISQIDLESNYNSFMVGYSLVWCEEIEGFDDEKRLKSLTGAKFLTLNEKYEKNKKVKNHSNFIIATNEIKSIKIDVNNRRWSFIGGGKRLVPKFNNWIDETPFKDEIENISFFKNYYKDFDLEIINIYKHLIARKVTRSRIQIPLNNELKKEMININKSSEIIFIDEIIELGIIDFVKNNIKFNPNLFLNSFIIDRSKEKLFNKGYWISNKDFYKLYFEFCQNNNYKFKLSNNILMKRLYNYQPFNDLFSDFQILKIDKVSVRCLKLTNYYDENSEIINSENITSKVEIKQK